MTALLILGAWALAVYAVTRLRYTPALPLPSRHTGPVTIPAVVNGHALTDAEVVESFLRVDLRLAGVVRVGETW